MIRKMPFALFAAVLFAGCSSAPTTHDQTDVASLEAARAPAAKCLWEPKSGAKECKEARANDGADQYVLDTKGNLFRYFESKRLPCQIAGNVADFTISMHPKDDSVIYFQQRNGARQDLYGVYKQDTVGGNCPPVRKELLMADIKEAKVVSSQDTTIVNAVLGTNGIFEAYDNKQVVYRDSGIKDFMMNKCYNRSGAPFNTVVLFTQDYGGYVTKVRVDSSQFGIFKFLKDDSNTDHTPFASIADFKKSRGVNCQ